MKILEACAGRGVAFYDDASVKHSTLDFIVEDGARALLLFHGWWRGPEMVPYVHFLKIPAQLIQTSLDTWAFADRPQWVIRSLDGDSEYKAASLAREAIDLDKEKYLSAVQRLSGEFTDYDFKEWVSMAEARPAKTTMQVFKERYESKRDILVATLTDPGGRIEDAIALDDNGFAEVYRENGWFSHIAYDWEDYSDLARPHVSVFTTRVASFSPPQSDLTVRDAHVVSQEGCLRTLLLSAVSAG